MRWGVVSAGAAREARARAPAMAAPAEIDATAPVSAPRNAIERARSLQEDVRQQAEDAGKKIDDETK
jgi:hypothetical protein